MQQCTAIACYTTAPLYNKIIIFDTVGLVRQKVNFKQYRYLATLAYVTGALTLPGQRTLPAYVDGRKREHSSCLNDLSLLHPDVSQFGCHVGPNLSLDGKLCFRDEKNAAFVHHLLPLQASIEKGHAMRAHKPQSVSDWLNPLSLGTMPAFSYIENLP